jgi:hypothetical protein
LFPVLPFLLKLPSFSLPLFIFFLQMASAYISPSFPRGGGGVNRALLFHDLSGAGSSF